MLFPLGLPDHGLFDWVDQLLQENPRRGAKQGFRFATGRCQSFISTILFVSASTYWLKVQTIGEHFSETSFEASSC